MICYKYQHCNIHLSNYLIHVFCRTCSILKLRTWFNTCLYQASYILFKSSSSFVGLVLYYNCARDSKLKHVLISGILYSFQIVFVFCGTSFVLQFRKWFKVSTRVYIWYPTMKYVCGPSTHPGHLALRLKAAHLTGTHPQTHTLSESSCQ